MNEAEWHEINAALTRFAAVEADWPKAVADELAYISRAAARVSKELEGHQCGLLVEWADEADKIWEMIEVSLHRESDAYCFPVTLIVSLNKEREMSWRLTGPDGKTVREFVGRRSDGEWVILIEKMVVANAKQIGA